MIKIVGSCLIVAALSSQNRREGRGGAQCSPQPSLNYSDIVIHVYVQCQKLPKYLQLNLIFNLMKSEKHLQELQHHVHIVYTRQILCPVYSAAST